MIYLTLFITFVKIGLLGFGGGMAIISLMQHEIENQGWMSQAEFVDIVAISQVTPGPIGINCATYVGYTATNSILGSLIASIAIVLPSLVIMLILCYIYSKVQSRWNHTQTFRISMRIIRIMVVLLIAHAAWRLITPETFIDHISWSIFMIVAILTAMPAFLPKQTENLSTTYKHIKKVTDIASHPILLIILSGITGYLIYA